MEMNKYLSTLLIGALMLTSSVDACTGLQVKTKDGSYISGRTLEFGIFLPTSVITVPRGYSFVGQTPTGDGKKWKTKYASAGVIIADNEVILDGINKGSECRDVLPSRLRYL